MVILSLHVGTEGAQSSEPASWAPVITIAPQMAWRSGESQGGSGERHTGRELSCTILDVAHFRNICTSWCWLSSHGFWNSCALMLIIQCRGTPTGQIVVTTCIKGQLVCAFTVCPIRSTASRVAISPNAGEIGKCIALPGGLWVIVMEDSVSWCPEFRLWSVCWLCGWTLPFSGHGSKWIALRH